MKISLIAALSENRVIGRDNKLIWHIPDDLKHFKEKTRGHPVIMGRKTFESIGRLLPNRTNTVITRDKNYLNSHPELVSGSKEERCRNPLRSEASKFGMTLGYVVQSLEEAIKIAEKDSSFIKASADKKEIFIIGGGQIFEQGIKIADKLYLTIIEGNFEGDTFFPDYSSFKKASESPVYEYNGMKYKFEEWEKL